LILSAAPRRRLWLGEGVALVDGFHWTRVTSKQLRFVYEEIATLPPPQKMKELADAIDRGLAAASGAPTPPEPPSDAPGILSHP